MTDNEQEISPELIEKTRLLFARPATFMLGIAKLDQLPPPALPELAFAGRSNVGKSSLINALTGRRSLARTSNTPGRTQEINFFDLNGRLCLVDLPGYGFAKAPVKQVEAWTRMVFAFLRGRPNLRRVCVLIDARHGLKKADLEAMELLGKAAVPFQIVLTKTDLVKAADLPRLIASIEVQLKNTLGAVPGLVLTSSKSGDGIDELRLLLGRFAEEPASDPASADPTNNEA